MTTFHPNGIRFWPIWALLLSLSGRSQAALSCPFDLASSAPFCQWTPSEPHGGQWHIGTTENIAGPPGFPDYAYIKTGVEHTATMLSELTSVAVDTRFLFAVIQTRLIVGEDLVKLELVPENDGPVRRLWATETTIGIPGHWDTASVKLSPTDGVFRLRFSFSVALESNLAALAGLILESEVPPATNPPPTEATTVQVTELTSEAAPVETSN